MVTRKSILPLFIAMVLVMGMLSARAATVTSTATGGTWATGSTWVGGAVPGTGDAVIIATTGANSVSIAANLTQTAAGSVTVNSGAILNVTTTLVTVSFGALTINSGGTANFSRPTTIQGATSVTGTINFGSTSGTSRLITFTGDVTLFSGSTWSEPGSGNGANNTYTFAGNFANNSTTFNALGTGVHTFSGTTKIISGSTTTSIASVAVTGTITCNGTLTVNTALSGAGTLTIGASGTLNIGGTCSVATLVNNGSITSSGTGAITSTTITNNLTFNMDGTGAVTAFTNTATGVLNISATPTVPTFTTLTVIAAGNTVNYDGTGAQTIKDLNYGGDLIISGSGTKTWTQATTAKTVTGDLTIGDGATLSVGGAFAWTVTGTTTIGAGTSGVLSLTNATGTKTFTGAVTINLGGTLSESAAAQLAFGNNVTITGTLTENGAALIGIAGSLTNNGTYTASTGVHTFSGTTQTISGSATNTITRVAVTGTYTNNGTLTVNTALSGGGTLTNGATGTLNIGGTCSVTTLVNNGSITSSGTGAITSATLTNNLTFNMDGTGAVTAFTNSATGVLNIGATPTVPVFTSLTLTAAGNTVNFDGAGNQTVYTTTYSNLTLSGTGNKTAAGALNITGNVLINSNFTAGIFTHTVSGNWTNSGTFTATGSTIDFNGTSSQNIGTSNFNNINFTNAGAKTATGALTIAGNVIITSNFTAGIFTHTVAENWTNNGTFTDTGSTIDFNGSGAGNIGTGSFNNVTFSGSGTKTALGALTITGAVNITGNFYAGGFTHTVSGDWTNTFIFNNTGSTIIFNNTNPQTINASTFNNLTLSGSGTKTIGGELAVGGTLAINSGGVADLATHTSSAGSLTLGGTGQGAGSWGSSASPATYNNDTYFALTTGIINVGLPSAWTMSSWGNRKSHIVNQTTGAGTNYQVMLTVYYGAGTDAGSNIYCGSNCQTDFDDIRFTDANGNELSYWRQSYTASTSAVFWVEIAGDLTSSAQTIYMYYGNAGATTTSHGPNTFLYFDDGNSNSSWTAGNPTTFDPNILGSSSTLGNPANAFRAISSGTGTGTGNTAQKYMYRNIPGFGPNTFTSFNTYTNTGNLGNLFFLCDANGAGQMYRIDSRGSANYSGFASTTSWSIWTAPSAGFTASSNTWYKFGIAVTNSLGTSTTLSYQATTDNNPLPGATTLGTYTSVNNGSYMGLGGDAVGGSLYTYMDNIITRKYVNPEPTQTAGSAQQARYVWTHGTSTDWQLAGNWTPTRTTPATTDVLIFNENNTLSVTNVPTQTVAELIFTNNTIVTLTAAVAPNTLSVNNLLSVAAGTTFNLGTGVILSGTLNVVNNFGTIKTAVPTATSTTPIPTGKTWSGTISYSASAGLQTVVAGTYKNLSTGNSSGSQAAAGAITVNGTLTTTAGGTLNMATYQLLGSLVTVANSGTIGTQCTTNPALPAGETWNGIVNFNGSSAQTVPSATSYSTLKINNAAGVSLGAVTSVTNLTIGDVTSGSLFNDAGFQLTASGTLTQTSGTFKLGSGSSATTWPGFATITLSAGTTVEYASGVAQSVSGTPAYQNLTFSGAGNKTAAAALTINGNVNISSGTFTAGSYTHTVGGNWTNSGTFTATASTINFNGSGAGNIGASNFNNVTFSGAGTKTATGALSIAGNVSITNNLSAGSFAHTVTGNWTNTATFTAGTSTISFNGTTVQTIGGASVTTFNNLTVNNGSGGSVTLANAETVSGTLTLTSGIITTTNANLLSVTSTSSAAVSGGSGTAYINGPLKWTLPAGLGSGSTYTFPLGKNSTYLPFALVNPTTGPLVVTTQAEAFDSNSGGTADGTTISSISTTEYWSLATTGNFTNSSVSLTRPTAISPFDAVGGSSSATGNYTSLLGTAGTYSVTNSSSIGSNRFFVFGRKNTITTSAISPTTYCAGAAVSVPFTITGTYNSGNVFTAQLSNASGSFASPVNIGSLTQTTAGSISATVPSNTPAGTGYRIRVVSSNPVVTGSDNGANLTVPANMTASAASTTPTLCINTVLSPVTHTTTLATGIGSATGLPAGVTAAYASNTITISGTPTASGTFNYSIPLTGGCGSVNATGTIIVTAANTAGSPSSSPTLCINTAISPSISIATTGATGIGSASNLPAGVTASWSSSTITISGTPTASGTFNYSIPLTGGCGSINATGTITVTAANTAGSPSSSPTLCINTAISPSITIATTGATGIGSATNLPAGVTASWASSTITISGTPTASGTFNYSIPLTGGCGSVNATGTITVRAANTAGTPSSSPTLCINTALSPNITIATTGATGIGSATNLPAGVTASWASSTITISGTPTASGTFNYSIPLTGGCGSINATGTIIVTAANTAGSPSSSPTLCINTAISPSITIATTGATGIGSATNLPAGVTASWASSTITISGTPTASGTFNYSIPLTGGCGSINATGTITVRAANTAGTPSSSPTLCINTALSPNITIATTGATGIGSATNLPAGVTASWASSTITISGTPTASGTFNYSIPLTGGCGSINATGTIIVTAANTAGSPSSSPTLCINTAISPSITIATTGATGIGSATNLPAGVTASWASSTITISGTPTASGTFNYSIPLTGGCGSINATGTIIVTAANTAGSPSSSPTLCINTAISPSITIATTGATGIGSATNLPAGVTASWASSTITISGTPTASGTFNYSIPLTGGCGSINATGTIIVTAANTAGSPSSSPTLCINTAISPSITIATTGATGIGSATNLPAGVTASWSSSTITISGTPTASGTFNYSIPLTGGCGSINATGTIIVTAANTAGSPSSSPTLCINTAISPSISIATTGATGIGSASNIPAGVTASWSSSTITISGTPTASGTFNYSIPLTGGCGSVNATGTIIVTAANTAGSPSSSPTLCINTAISPSITIATTGATGIGSATNLPAGVTASWASSTITISGTPTASGTFNYSIPLTGGCGSVNATGTITVRAANTAGTPSSSPTLCINTALSPNITIATTGATGIGSATNLPAGVTASWASSTITISGTPTASGTFNYSIPLTGGCGSINATGTIIVTAANTAGSPSSSPTLCINTAISPSITIATTGATGIGSATNLPAGVTASWASSTITISGTPTASGTFNYSIPLTGGCGSINATGTITVRAANTAGTPSSSPTLCINTALSPNITIATTGATGIGSATNLPAGVTASWSSSTITISGTPTASGTFNYSIPLTGGCGSINATGTIIVTAANTAGSPSSSPTLCVNTAISPSITIATTGATGIGSVTNLPAGVTASWSSSTITISGTPTASGTFNYSIPLTGGCGSVNATGTIIVTAANTAGSPSSSPTLCINTAISPSITIATTGTTGIGSATNLPAGVTASWASSTITISGTPTASGTFNYSIPLTGGCGSINATGTIIVTAANTAGSPSSSPTLCINTAISPSITIATTGATGIGSATNLPAGVTASWSSSTITISGTPTASGTFNYSIPLTGGCGSINATGTITVRAANTAGTPSSSPTLCINTPLSPNITIATTGATGIGSATNLPTGVTASWSTSTITISGTPTASGTFNYSIPLTGGCGSVNATGTIIVTAANTAGSPSSSPTLCINTAISPSITIATTGATGIGSATNLPAGVTASWSSSTITISGTPTASGTFNYSIPLTGGCGSVNATGTIIVTAANTAGSPSSSPTLCINTAISPSITIATSGATGIGSATNLPAGVTASWASSTITISGTPTASGTFNYSIPLTGGCGSINATGIITVRAANTAGSPSSSPTLCINTALSPNITIATTGATGIGSATNLPAGVTASWASSTITISGTPTASGTFNYSIPLTGGCGSINATGTIIVTAANTAGSPSSSPTLCINTAISPSITIATTGATGIGSATNLPAGVTASWSSSTITISGTPTASGTFNYSIPLTGGCGSVNATGTIMVNALPAATLSGTNTICLGSSTNLSVALTGTAPWSITYTDGTTPVTIIGIASSPKTISVSPASTRTYSLTAVSDANCTGTSFTGSAVITVNSGIWVGTTSIDWHTASNWCGGVPTAAINVTIPSGTPFQPVISATAVCNSITINPGATLAISGSNLLTVSGSWTNNGTFTPNTSTVTFNSNVPSTINASTFNNVIINGTGTKTETGDINVNGNLTLNAGTFALNNSTTQTRNLTIAGNYLQSGGVLDFNPTGYGAISTLTIAGDFTNTAGAGSITTGGGGAINGQVVFNGSSTQTITFSNPAASEWTTYLSNAGSNVKFGSNITLTGDYSLLKYYADFIVNGTIDFGTYVLNDTPNGGNPDASHFTLNSGASLVTANTDGISLSGSTGSVQFNGPRAYNGSANYTYNGASAQVTGNGLTTANNLTSNNSAGLTLSNNVTVTGTLTFTSGLITTGANTLIMGSSGSISGASSSRYINGKLAWIYTTSGGSKTFPIGKGGNYRSLTLNYTTGPDNQSTVTAEQFESTLPGTLPSYTTLFGDRYWSISQAGATTYAFTLTLDGTGFSPVHALDAVMLKGDGIGAYSTNAVTFSSPNYTNTTAFTGFGYFGLAESGKIWTGASSTNWFTSGNWSSNVVPDGSGSIIIPSSLSTYPQISGTSPANDVSILSGGSLSIQTGANLTLQAGPVFTLVSGSTVTTSGTGMIIIETGSKYLNYSSNTPTLQVKNLLANTSKGWRMVAAPVTTTYSDMFKSPLVTQGFTGSSFPTLQPNVLTWDETDGGTTLQAWRQPTNLSNAISSGRGHFFYIFNGAGRLNLDGTPSGSNYTDDLSTSIILSATGSDNSMVSGSYNYTLTRTPRTVKPTPTSTTDSTAYASNTGWNLVGNPTASTLNWDASGAWTKTNTDNTIYIWDPTANSGSGNYLTWNGTTGTLGNGRISPFQAFWVRANAASPALSFTNNAKTATAGTFYKNDQANEVVTVPITLNFDGMTSTSFISLGDNGAIGEDPRDAYRLEPMSKTWLALYMNSSPSDNMPLVINNLPIDVKEEMSIPLYVDAMENSNKAGGSYTLRWEIPDNWPVRLSITLMDHNQKKAISMLDTREFTFTRSAAKSSMAAAVNPLDVPGNLVLPTGQNTGFKSHEDQPFTIVIGLITNINDPGYVDNKPMLLPLAPNPFSDRTLLSFRLPEAAPVRIEVYNMMGQLVDVPVSGEYSAGLTQIDWYPKFSATGTYQVRMTSRNTVQTIKCIKIR